MKPKKNWIACSHSSSITTTRKQKIFPLLHTHSKQTTSIWGQVQDYCHNNKRKNEACTRTCPHFMFQTQKQSIKSVSGFILFCFVLWLSSGEKEKGKRQKTMKKQKNASSNNTKFVDNSQGHHKCSHLCLQGVLGMKQFLEVRKISWLETMKCIW